jgi:hypothetical protein
MGPRLGGPLGVPVWFRSSLGAGAAWTALHLLVGFLVLGIATLSLAALEQGVRIPLFLVDVPIWTTCPLVLRGSLTAVLARSVRFFWTSSIGTVGGWIATLAAIMLQGLAESRLRPYRIGELVLRLWPDFRSASPVQNTPDIDPSTVAQILASALAWAMAASLLGNHLRERGRVPAGPRSGI